MKNKTIILMLLITFSFSGLAYNRYTRIVDEERDGYGKVGASSETNESGGTTTEIGCATPGTWSCPTISNDGSDEGISANARTICINFAHDKIANGTNTGRANINIAGIVYTVTWLYNTQTTGERIEIIQL